MNERIEKIKFHEQVPFDTPNHSIIGVKNESTGKKILLAIVRNTLSTYIVNECNKEYDIEGYKFFMYPMNTWFGSAGSSPLENDTIPKLWSAYKAYQSELEQSIQNCYSGLQKMYELDPRVDPSWPAECREYFSSLSQHSSAELEDITGITINTVDTIEVETEEQRQVDVKEEFVEEQGKDTILNTSRTSDVEPVPDTLIDRSTIDECPIPCISFVEEVAELYTPLHIQNNDSLVTVEEGYVADVQGKEIRDEIEKVAWTPPMEETNTMVPQEKEGNEEEACSVQNSRKKPSRKNQTYSLNKRGKKTKNISISSNQ